jgi:hypothetical protein
MIKIFLTLIIFILQFQSIRAHVYTIKSGKHYAQGINASLFINDQLNLEVKFDESAEYYLGNSNQNDINKLFGFSDCSSHHHKNSARFGWRWNDQSKNLEILAYVYSHGKRSSQFIDIVPLNEKIQYSIRILQNQYEFNLNNKKITMPRGCNDKKALGYRLYPFFGGDEVAPHEIKIEVNKVSKKL